MTVPSVTPLPTAPSRSRPDTFATEADAFLGALDTFETELNALGDAVETSTAAAAVSETNAAASEAAAATSETNAATSETNAALSETNAASSAASAAASFDSFDDRYLGPKASDPATDNDGDPLSGGMIYYNTGSGTLKLYNGSAWVSAVLDANGALLAANNLSDLTNAATARTNLGLDSIDPTKATLTKSFVAGETSSIALSAAITSGGPVVAVIKEVPQIGVSSKGGWDVSATAANYELYNEAPATSLSLSSTTVDGTATLGTGSFSASDVGKRIFVDDGGEAILTATDGSFSLVSEFGASTYTSGNWSLSGLDVDATNGITLSGSVATAQPTAQYLPAITSPAGQIDSQYWTDINGMTADDVDNDGQVYYAVSTDDRTTWSVAKGTDGVRPVVRNNGGTWEYNSAVVAEDAWDVSTGSFLQSFSVNAEESSPLGVFFKPDGTKMYVVGSNGDEVNEYDLSTAWDISTATFLQLFSVAAQEAAPQGVFFKPDGLKMYIVGSGGDDVNEYDLSTAWDVSSASFLQLFSVAAQDGAPTGIFFKPDGLKMYIVGEIGDEVNEYDLSTAWDISTATFLQLFSVAGQDTSPNGIFFKPDGLKMYVAGATGDAVYEYNLSTAWDISSASFLQNFSVAAQDTSPLDIFFKPDGTKMYIIGGFGDSVYEYNVGTEAYTTSATWNSATTNNEFAALAEALGATAVNQMDKAQLDAVADGSHFTLGNTLDLAIIPYLASAGTAPTSDAVAINYDAAVLNKGAILGTDYDYDFPESSVVRLTSLGTQNLKVRIV